MWSDLADALEARMPDVENYPCPEGEEREEVGDGLFNSQRTYLEQLHAYKTFQGKDNGFGGVSLDLLEV